MFRKVMVGLVVTVAMLGTQVESANAQIIRVVAPLRPRIIVPVRPAIVLPVLLPRPIIRPVVSFYVAPTVTPIYQPVYPAPVVVPVAPTFTVLYRANVADAWTIHSSHRSQTQAYATADGLAVAGYYARVSE